MERVSWTTREEDLLNRVLVEDDRQALEEFVRLMLPLARTLARKYQRRREPLDDLVQVASLGLLKAIQRFDPDRGAEFLAFAVPTITGELKRHYRDNGWSVHVARSLQERALKVEGELRQLSVELGRSPSPAELAVRCGLSTEELLEARHASEAYTAVSLDAPVGDDPTRVPAPPAREDEGYRLIEEADALAPVLRALPPRERRILKLRFVEDLTQQEIAERIGISQMHASRLLRRALDRVGVVVAHQY
jgi:RNA polymerase sigma-B factor